MNKPKLLAHYAVGLCHRLAYGLLASLITIAGIGIGVHPGRHERAVFYLGKVLNLPVALAERLTNSYSGVELWFDRGLGSPPDEPSLEYLKHSTPTYLVLSYLPTVIVALCRWWRGGGRSARDRFSGRD